MLDNDQRMILDLEDRRYGAMLSGDVALLSELCSDKLTYTHSRGERDDKKSYLDKVAASFFLYHEIAHPADNVVVAGNAALVTGRMTARVSVSGAVRSIDNSYLAVWLREDDGEWRFAAYQPTPIPAA